MMHAFEVDHVVLRSQYGRMEVSQTHGKKGRLVLDFAGYHPDDESELYSYLKKVLKTICINNPEKVSDSLRRVVQPGWNRACPSGQGGEWGDSKKLLLCAHPSE